MATVRIYQLSKPATQSGKGKTKKWRVEFEAEGSLTPDFLMGWVSSRDTLSQLRLSFPSLERALHFANIRGAYSIVCPSPPILESLYRYHLNFTNPRLRGR